MAEVSDSLVIGVEEDDGGYYMPLFVVLTNGASLTPNLQDKIMKTIRSRTSSRHVPDTIIQAPQMPVTHAGKKIEILIKRMFLGREPEAVVNTSSLANPDAIEWFTQEARYYRLEAEHGTPRVS